VSDVATVALKALAGGSLVLVFAALGAVVKPKRFAGLFGAAPAVAIAGLAITLATKPVHDAHENVIGMLAGCAGIVAYAAAVAPLLLRTAPLRASALTMVLWLVVAAGVAAPLVA